MIWFVHRRQDGSIASAHETLQPGYAEEARDDTTDADIIAHRRAATEPVDDKFSAMIRRRAVELEKGDLSEQVAALRLRLSLVEGS